MTSKDNIFPLKLLFKFAISRMMFSICSALVRATYRRKMAFSSRVLVIAFFIAFCDISNNRVYCQEETLDENLGETLYEDLDENVEEIAEDEPEEIVAAAVVVPELIKLAKDIGAPFAKTALDRIHSEVFGNATAPRSTDVVIFNKSKKSFKLNKHSCRHGGYVTNFFPEYEIAAKQSSVFVMKSGSLFGVKCTTRYQSVDGTFFEVIARNPYVGKNWMSETHSSDLDVISTLGNGNNNQVRWIVEDRTLAPVKSVQGAPGEHLEDIQEGENQEAEEENEVTEADENQEGEEVNEDTETVENQEAEEEDEVTEAVENQKGEEEDEVTETVENQEAEEVNDASEADENQEVEEENLATEAVENQEDSQEAEVDENQEVGQEAEEVTEVDENQEEDEEVQDATEDEGSQDPEDMIAVSTVASELIKHAMSIGAPFGKTALARIHSELFGNASAPRSTDVIIFNKSNKSFKLNKHQCRHGGYVSNSFPEHEIAAKQSSVFSMKSSSALGLECTIHYQSVDGNFFEVVARNPFVGKNRMAESHSSGLDVTSTLGNGNNNQVRWIVEDRTSPPVKSFQYAPGEQFEDIQEGENQEAEEENEVTEADENQEGEEVNEDTETVENQEAEEEDEVTEAVENQEVEEENEATETVENQEGVEVNEDTETAGNQEGEEENLETEDFTEVNENQEVGEEPEEVTDLDEDQEVVQEEEATENEDIE